MKKGDFVKFKTVVDKGDETIRMRLREDPDGGRVLVEHLLNLSINPTNIYKVDDLELAEDFQQEKQQIGKTKAT